jgi:diaminopimelate epimerase
MHGAGNDYIYVNAMQEHVVDPSTLAQKLSDRHFGIGSDGLVLILPSEKADFRMRMFNYDGSEAEMCGNASRCVGKYVYDKGLTKKTSIKLETNSGIKTLDLIIEKGQVSLVRVDMGEPILDPLLIPVKTNSKRALLLPLTIDGLQYELTCVSMGNPHAVIFTGNIDDINLPEIGPKFEYHPIFTNRTNTEFVEVIDPEHVRMRVWERGAGETLACGTGACAVLVAGVLCGLLKSRARVDLPGGSLEIEWDRLSNHVYMTGGATTVFEGDWICPSSC